MIFPYNDTMTYFGNDRALADYEEQAMEYDLDEAHRHLMPWVRDRSYTILLSGLLRNESFRTNFVNRFADLMNSWYREDIFTAGLETAMSLIRTELDRHIQRWSVPQFLEHKYRDNLEFARLRSGIQREHLHAYFLYRGLDIGPKQPLHVALPAEGGLVRVNSLVLDRTVPGAVAGTNWRGLYFGNLPVELEAIPAAGWRFAGWHGLPPGQDASRALISVLPTEELALVPVFVRAPGD
jgi:hypothetical protein